MQEIVQIEVDYVMRVDEILWGGLLLALVIAIHGIGMLQTLRAITALTARTEALRSRHPSVSLGILVLAAWMIVLFHLLEVMVWSGFFVWMDAVPSLSSSLYNAMLNYCTLQAGYLPLRWRLLEGMVGMSGLLTFAWSTSILFSLVQPLIHQELARSLRRASPPPGPGGA